jgi:hypothetical protein
MSFKFYYHAKYQMMVVEIDNKEYVCNDIIVNVPSKTVYNLDKHPTFAMVGECKSYEFLNHKMILI